MAIENDKLNQANDIVRISIPTEDGNITIADFGEGSVFGAKIDHGFWINDLYFEVAPEKISSQEENNFLEFQGIRSRHAHKIPVGISSEYFTLNLTIPSRDAIVNKDTRPDSSVSNNTGKRGGVLDLAIQFKYIPFACIENAYLRSKLKIPPTHNMVFCLHNITFSTSPGEPGNIVASLTISLMAYTPYSDRWTYKKDWVSKNGLSFEDVNPINLQGRIPYKVNTESAVAENSSKTGEAKAEEIAEFGNQILVWQKNLFGTSSEFEKSVAANSEVNITDPKYSEVDSLNSIDVAHMAPFEITRFPRESAVFKAYVDWLHDYHTKVPIKYLEYYDCTKILPYGGNEKNIIGDKIILKYKEFKTIPIDNWTADKIRIFFKKRVTKFRASLFKGIYSGLDSLEAEIEDSDAGYEDDLEELNNQNPNSRNLFKKALASKAFANYKTHVETAKENGWILYTDDPTSLDMFYKEHEVEIACNSLISEYKTTPSGEHLLTCDFISCAAQNQYKKIPIQGVIHPTAQFLGQPDNQYLLSIKGIGLNSVKILDLIKDTIKKQALVLKYIPESYVIKAENPFLNMLGDVYFVINGLESSTTPEQPGLYSMELRLTGTSIYIKDTKIKRESITSTKNIRETFLKELLEPDREKEKKLTIGFERSGGGANYRGRPGYTHGFYVYSPDGHRSTFLEELAATFNLMNFLIIRNEDSVNLGKNQAAVNEGQKNAKGEKMIPLVTLLDEFANTAEGFKIFYNRFKDDIVNVAYKGGGPNSLPLHFFIRSYRRDLSIIENITADYVGWLNESFGKQDAVNPAANLSLLAPVAKASEADKQNYALNFYESPTVFPEDKKFSIAPNYWDYILEKSPSKLRDSSGRPYYYGKEDGNYSLEDPIVRASAWAKVDAFDVLPYAKAKEAWQDTKKFWEKPPKDGRYYTGLMFPYIACHRKVMAISQNTISNRVANLILDNIKNARASSKYRYNPLTPVRNIINNIISGEEILIDFLAFSNIDTNELLRQQNSYINPIFKYKIVIQDLATPVPEYENGEYAINIKNYLLSLDHCFTKRYFSAYPTEFNKNGVDIENYASLDYNNTVEELNKIKYILNRLKTTITLVDDNVRRYLLKYQVEPYLINALRFEDIYLLVTQTPYFPKTRSLIIKEEQSRVAPAYEDVILPYHPYWNSPKTNEKGDIISYNNGPRGASFTEPDFYLSNPGIDFPESQSLEGSLSLEVKDEKLLKQVKATPEDLYNLYIDLAAEYARGDVEGLSRKTNLLNADRKSKIKKDANKKDKTEAQPGYTGEFGDIEQAAGKQYLGITSELYKNNMTPKNFIDEKRRTADHIVRPTGVDSNGNPFIEGTEWGGERLNFSDVSFIFGDNADFMDPLVSNFQYETNKLRTSRLANWSYQEYDFEQHEIRKVRLRNQYAVNQVDLPSPKGGKSSNAKPTSEDKINFFYSNLYIEKAQEDSENQSLLFEYDPVLIDQTEHVVDYTNAFGQVRVQPDAKKVEFFGKDLNTFGSFNFTGPSQIKGNALVDGKLKDDVGYRFHKGIDIFPKASLLPPKQIRGYELITGYKINANPDQKFRPRQQTDVGGARRKDLQYTVERITKRVGGDLSGGFGTEFKNLIPMFAPWDMEFEGAEKSGLYKKEFEISGWPTMETFNTHIHPEFIERSSIPKSNLSAIDDPNLFFFEEQSNIFALDKTVDYTDAQIRAKYGNTLDDLSYQSRLDGMSPMRRAEALDRSDAIRLSLKTSNHLGFHFFRDPYVNKMWLVFKNGQGWGNPAGLRSAWKITSGPLQNTTLLLMHQSYMVEGESILNAWQGDSFSRDRMKEAIENRDGEYIADYLRKTTLPNFDSNSFQKNDPRWYMALFGTDPKYSHVQSVKAGEFIGFIGRTGFKDANEKEHAHVEICYRMQKNNLHAPSLHGIGWRIDLGPLLEGGSVANKAVIDAYYKVRAAAGAWEYDKEERDETITVF